MALETGPAHALRGYMFFQHPTSKTLGILRIDTEPEQHWFLVTKETLLKLSEALAKEAEKLEPLQ